MQCKIKLTGCSENHFTSSPLHVELGLMIHLVKALNKDYSSFKYLQCKFSSVSDAELGAGMLNGPQIRELMTTSTLMKFYLKQKKSMNIF